MNRAVKIIMYILIGTLCCGNAATAAASGLRDSLRSILAQTSDQQKRIDLLMGVIDLTSQGEDDSPDAVRLYKEAVKVGDDMGITAALGTIAVNMIDKPDLRDSIESIFKTTEKLLKNTPYDGMPTYYQMAYKVRRLAATDRDNRLATCNSISEALSGRIPVETEYQRCERFFVMAVIEYLLNSMSETPRNETIRSSLEQAWELAMKFPLSARRVFGGNIYIMLSDIYTHNDDDKRLISLSNQYLRSLDDYYDSEAIKTRRPHIYKDDAYLLAYQLLMSNGKLIGAKKAKEYYGRFCKFMKEGKGDALLRNDFYFYQYSYQYFMSTGQYSKALKCNDSVIIIIQKQGSPNQEYVMHYKNRARALEAAGRADDACDAYEKAIYISDSITNKQHIEEIGRYLVDYEINELEFNKTQLSSRNHTIALWSSGMIIFVLAGFSIYSHRNIVRIRKLQNKLIEEAGKAQQSDLQKTQFINSICHEVRTPLNSIHGFSELIAEGYATLDRRKEYAEIIKSNCRQLKYLLNDLLYVTYLENLPGLLPTGTVDIDEICRRQMEIAKCGNASGNIEYRTDLRVGKQAVYSNSKYLEIMLSALLSNAVKFTAHGPISIAAYTDHDNDDEIVIEVADSGCGIPKDKYAYVFERFTKIDSFSQGNGLGLYLCRLIVPHLGGTIAIDGEYRGGTKIVVRLPANPYMRSAAE